MVLTQHSMGKHFLIIFNIVEWFRKRELLGRFLFFFTLTFVYILVIGYYYGTFDQNSHIPFLLKTFNPNLFPRDPFFLIKDYHYSYFWYLFIPFLHYVDLPFLLFSTYVIVIFFTFVLLFSFFELLFKDKMTSYLSTLMLIVPKFTFSPVTLTEFSLLNRTFVLPFIIFALILFLKKRYYFSFLLLGLLYNFHVLSVHFVLVMFFFYVLFLRNWKDFFAIIRSFPLFIVFALPVLLWKFGNSSLDFSVDAEWYSVLCKGGLAHLFNFFVPSFMILPFLSGIASVCMFLFVRHKGIRSPYDKQIFSFVVGIVISTFVVAFLYQVYPFVFLVQSQFLRIGKYLPLFVTPYFVYFLVSRYRASKLTFFGFLIIVISMIILPLYILPPIFYFLERKKILKKGFSFAVVFIHFLVVLLLFFSLSWRPLVHIEQRQDSWVDIQNWAREHTDIASMFLVPVHKWHLNTSDFRTFSQRGAFVLFGDIFELAFYPGYLPIWKTRMEVLFPGLVDSFQGDYLSNLRELDKAYQNIPGQRLIEIARENDLDFIVVQAGKTLDLDLVYANNDYWVYHAVQ